MYEPKPIGDFIMRERRRLWNTCPGLGLRSLWEKAAGQEVAANTTVVSLRDGLMTVGCSSGSWACELKFQAAELTEKINQLNPPERVREIRFTNAAAGGWKSRK